MENKDKSCIRKTGNTVIMIWAWIESKNKVNFLNNVGQIMKTFQTQPHWKKVIFIWIDLQGQFTEELWWWQLRLWCQWETAWPWHSEKKDCLSYTAQEVVLRCYTRWQNIFWSTPTLCAKEHKTCVMAWMWSASRLHPHKKDSCIENFTLSWCTQALRGNWMMSALT
jgi:hypothetical protein